jgi:hypothetical protein
MMDPLVAPLRSRRQQRARLAQKLQHVFPSIVLLVAGVQQFGEHPRGWGLALAVLQIVVGALMLGMLANSVHGQRHLLKRSRQGYGAGNEHAASRAHAGIEWENLVAAAMVLAEGWEHRMHGGHHFPRPAILTAAVLLATGMAHGRILRFAEGRRALRVDDDGLAIGGRPFRGRKLRARWADLASIEIEQRWAVIRTRSGRERKLDLQDLEGADHVRHALAVAQERLAERRG